MAQVLFFFLDFISFPAAANTRPIGRWRRYETPLEPMRDTLIDQDESIDDTQIKYRFQGLFSAYRHGLQMHWGGVVSGIIIEGGKE